MPACPPPAPWSKATTATIFQRRQHHPQIGQCLPAGQREDPFGQCGPSSPWVRRTRACRNMGRTMIVPICATWSRSDGSFHLFGDWKYDAFADTSLSNVHESTLGDWSATRMTPGTGCGDGHGRQCRSSGFAIGSVQCRSTLTAPTNAACRCRVSESGAACNRPPTMPRASPMSSMTSLTATNICGKPIPALMSPAIHSTIGRARFPSLSAVNGRLESINGYVRPDFQSGWQVGN